MKKKIVPKATRIGKFFLSLGTKFMMKEVMVYVIVSIEKIIPTSQIGNSSYFILNWSRGSLKVRHIREVDMQSAQEVTLNLPSSPKNVSLIPSSSWKHADILWDRLSSISISSSSLMLSIDKSIGSYSVFLSFEIRMLIGMMRANKSAPVT